MRGCLGLSVGATNLVAVADQGPIVRRAVLTLFGDRMPEVGLRDGDGLVVAGFVDRVGDPIPLLAADGSAHRGEQLLAAAVESLTRVASPAQRPERTVVAVPAHWAPAAFDAARAALPGVRVVSDAVAALTAMQAHPGLPARGVVALCDFGATGTSLTLAEADAGFAPIAQTVRHEDFSGDLVDQELLRHVLSGLDAEASGTAAVAALSRLREESRAAKERLSYEGATGLAGPAPGSMLRLTRAELEAVVDAPLGGVIEALHDLLRRTGVHPAQLAALVTVGGTARIPLVTQRLSEAFRMRVTTVAQAQVVTAVGAGLLARRGEAETAATQRAVLAAPFSPASSTGTVSAASLAPAALAWSVSDPAAEVMDYIPESVAEDSARPAFVFTEPGPDREPVAAARAPWYRGILVCAAALLTVVGTAGLLLSAHADKLDAAPAGTPAVPGLAPAEAPLAQVGSAPPTRTVVVQDPSVPGPAPAVSPSSAPYSVQRQQVAPVPQAAAPGPPAAADPAPADIPAPAALPPAPELPPIPQLPIPALPLPQLPLPQLPVPQLPVPQLPIPTFAPPPPPTHTPTPEPTHTPTPEPTHTHTAPPPPEPTHTQAPEPAPAPSSPPKPEHSTEPTTSAVPTP